MSTFRIALHPPPRVCFRVKSESFYLEVSRSDWLLGGLSVESHLSEGKQAGHLSVTCAGNVHQMCVSDTNKHKHFSASARVSSPVQDPVTVFFFRNNCCKTLLEGDCGGGKKVPSQFPPISH